MRSVTLALRECVTTSALDPMMNRSNRAASSSLNVILTADSLDNKLFILALSIVFIFTSPIFAHAF
jgi:hypothetical protein